MSSNFPNDGVANGGRVDGGVNHHPQDGADNGGVGIELTALRGLPDATERDSTNRVVRIWTNPESDAAVSSQPPSDAAAPMRSDSTYSVSKSGRRASASSTPSFKPVIRPHPETKQDFDNIDGVHLLSRASLARRYATTLSGIDMLEPILPPGASAAAAAAVTSTSSATSPPHLPTPASTDAAAGAGGAAAVPGGPAVVSNTPFVRSTLAQGGGRRLSSRMGSYSRDPSVLYQRPQRQDSRSRLAERKQSGMPDIFYSAGLSPDVHERRLAELGPNIVTPLEHEPMWLRYLKLYIQPFMVALIFAAALSLAMFIVDSKDQVKLNLFLVLVFVIIFSCTMEFYQEYASKSKMAAFATLVPKQAMVLRGGRRIIVSAASLVVGDLVVLRTGDQTAADMRILYANALKIDSSAVTGEAEPVTCSPFYDGTDASDLSSAQYDELEAAHELIYQTAPVTEFPKPGAQPYTTEQQAAAKIRHLPFNEAKNIVFAGCNVLEGEGLGVVFATADRSMVGQVIRLTTGVETKMSSLQRETIHLVFVLGIFAIVQAFLLLFLGIGRKLDIQRVFTESVISIICANIPQGLPTVVMTCMTVIAGRMIEQKVYVKQLPNMETLGCATVIASDKTGTLTQNKMTVTRVWVDQAVMTPSSALVNAHPSAIFTRFDPLALQYAQPMPPALAYKSGGSSRALTRHHSHFRSIEEGGDEENDVPDASPGAYVSPLDTNPDLQVDEINAARLAERVAGGEVARLNHTLAIMEIVCGVCNQTRFEDESPLVADRAFGLQRLQSYQNKDWATREADRAAIAHKQSERKALGEPSDLAIFNFVAARQNIELLRFKYPVLFHLPFNSTNKFMLTAVELGHSGRVLVLIKGAPEIVLARCARYQYMGRSYVINQGFKGKFQQQYTTFAAAGERVIAAAYLEMSTDIDEFEDIFDDLVAGDAEAPTSSTGAVGAATDDSANEAKSTTGPAAASAAASATATAAAATHRERLPRAPAKWSDKTFPTSGFTFLGLLSLTDPPKETVPDAVKAVRAAGVRVIMVTGDHPLTAKAIARQVNIITLPTQDEVDAAAKAVKEKEDAIKKGSMVTKRKGTLKGAPTSHSHSHLDDADGDVIEATTATMTPISAIATATASRDVTIDIAPDYTDAEGVPQIALVATGADIRHWSEDDWVRNLKRPEIVFARTTPQQKLEIVEHLQKLKHIVCVTGDGVNDSPALKQADIGVAMGISGSDVAREAADVILLNDDFSSIVAGIKEGRLLFANLTKVVAYTLTHAWPEVIPVLAQSIFSIPVPLGAMAVLAIDCGTEVAPSIALVYQQPEANLMTTPPRDTKKDRLITPRLMGYSYGVMGLMMTLVCFTSYFVVFLVNDVPISWLAFSDNYWKAGAPLLYTPGGRIYTDQQQLQILSDAQAAYWMTIVMSQFFNIFLCKTRLLPCWFYGIFDNMHLAFSVMVELAIMFCLIFIPVINSEGFSFGTIPAVVWAVPFTAWALYFAYAEGSKAIRRNYPDSTLAKIVGF